MLESIGTHIKYSKAGTLPRKCHPAVSFSPGVLAFRSIAERWVMGTEMHAVHCMTLDGSERTRKMGWCSRFLCGALDLFLSLPSHPVGSRLFSADEGEKGEHAFCDRGENHRTWCCVLRSYVFLNQGNLKQSRKAIGRISEMLFVPCRSRNCLNLTSNSPDVIQ